MPKAFHLVLIFAALSGACGGQAATPRASTPEVDAGSRMGSGTGGSTGTGGFGAGGAGISIVLDGAALSDGNVSCATDTKEANQRPLDLYILLDQSGSMTKFPPNRWEPTVAALKDFIGGGRLDGVGVGLNYFPQALGQMTSDITDETIKCDPATYRTPAVPIAPLPDNAKALTDSIDAHHFTSAESDTVEHYGTPTTQALTGVYAYLQEYGSAHPDDAVVLLLATDGQPLICGPGHYGKANDPDSVTAAIAAAAAATASVKTYVVGIGPDVGNLDAWAAAGGTGQVHAFLVQIDATAREQFLSTLLSIRNLALPCDFAIPTVSLGPLDPTKVNVQHVVGGAPPVRFTQVADASMCQPNQSNWYYDDPANPTRVIACPAACAELGQGGKVEIVYGCKTDVSVH
jgi:hypothetical protein